MYRTRVRQQLLADDSEVRPVPDVVWPDPSPLSGWWQHVMFPESVAESSNTGSRTIK